MLATAGFHFWNYPVVGSKSPADPRQTPFEATQALSRREEMQLLLPTHVSLRCHVVQPHRNELRDAQFLHRDAVESIGRLHRTAVMRHNDELAALRELAQHLAEAADVGLIQRRVHLIEDAERAGTHLEEREQ